MDLVEIYNTWNEQKAEMIKGLLEDYGIECFFSSHASRTVHPFNVNGLGEIKIMVSKDYQDKAKEIVNTFFQEEK